jgi:phage terminase small subunit
MTKPVSLETRQRQSRAQLSRKQLAFVEQYVALGNGTEAARRAGYSGSANSLGVQAHHNIRHPKLAPLIEQKLAKMPVVTPVRVQRRLHDISLAAQDAGQFGPAVRAEELLGKSIGMWIDRSLQLSGHLNDSHVQALLELARKRQAEPFDLADEESETRSGSPSSQPCDAGPDAAEPALGVDVGRDAARPAGPPDHPQDAAGGGLVLEARRATRLSCAVQASGSFSAVTGNRVAYGRFGNGRS